MMKLSKDKRSYHGVIITVLVLYSLYTRAMVVAGHDANSNKGGDQLGVMVLLCFSGFTDKSIRHLCLVSLLALGARLLLLT